MNPTRLPRESDGSIKAAGIGHRYTRGFKAGLRPTPTDPINAANTRRRFYWVQGGVLPWARGFS